MLHTPRGPTCFCRLKRAFNSTEKMLQNTLYSSANNSIACSALRCAVEGNTVRIVSVARGGALKQRDGTAAPADVAQEQHFPRTAGW